LSEYPWRKDVSPEKVAERPGVYLFKDERGRVLYVG
jgi:excinuclease UvrABC nuclease subunit